MLKSRRLLLAAACAAACQFAFVTHAQDADLTAKLKQGVALQLKLNSMFAEVAAQSKGMAEAMQKYLPKADTPAGQYTWTGQYSSASFYYQVRNKANQQVALVQLIYHPDGYDAKANGMQAECLGMPANRVLNRRVWVLVGKLELRVEAQAAELQTDAALDAFVKSFDLEGLKQL